MKFIIFFVVCIPLVISTTGVVDFGQIKQNIYKKKYIFLKRSKSVVIYKFPEETNVGEKKYCKKQ